MNTPALLLAPAVELALNQALAGSSAAARDRERLAGKTIALELKELPVRLWFLPNKEKITVRAAHDGKPDVTVRAPSLALLAAALKRSDTPPRGIELHGDAETAQTFSRLLRQADLDWEGLLARYVGDTAAHEFGKFARGLLRWGQDAGTRLSADLAEYLIYERHVLPARHEVTAFLDGVDRLRSDVDRLEARLKRLPRPAGKA